LPAIEITIISGLLPIRKGPMPFDNFDDVIIGV
jgi:hypothetical protein